MIEVALCLNAVLPVESKTWLVLCLSKLRACPLYHPLNSPLCFVHFLIGFGLKTYRKVLSEIFLLRSGLGNLNLEQAKSLIWNLG